MYLSVIIPMYNERAAVAECAAALTKELENSPELIEKYEIIFSDDGSDDGCGDIAKGLADEIAVSRGKLRVVSADKNYGKGHAVRLGMTSAEGDTLLFTDCDLAYGARAVLDMAQSYAQGMAGTDILIGSRALHPDGYSGYTPLRKLASKAYLRLLSMFAGFSHTDSQCGIKLFSRDSALALCKYAEVDRWAFDLELLLLAARLGFRVREYPVKVINHRQSKIRLLRDSLRMLNDTRKIKSRLRRLKL